MDRNRRIKVRRGIVRYIVVHSTGTRQDMQVKELEKLPYHYLLTKKGRLISLKPFQPKDGTIELAWLGGLDEQGRHVDNRTEEQNESLFTTLLLLSERFPEAKVVGADQLYVYGFANPGFDIRAWLDDYMPAFLQAA